MHTLALLFLLQNENSSASAASALGLGAFMAAYGIFVLVIVIISLIINWRIASKAGYPGVASLLLLIPLVNLIVIIYFAFAEWPIERELRAMRATGRAPAPTT